MTSRLDILLSSKGLAKSRENAKRLIESGKVRVNSEIVTKASRSVDENAVIEVEKEKYVSRGGFKLEKALDTFGIDVSGKTMLDCGASTGGFTDCLLQNGAEKVYAVDVGTSQLDESLRNDSRVVSIENTNIRYLEKTDWLGNIEGVVADVSFISLRLILERLFVTVPESAFYVCLVKPQFEAGKENLNKNGIVKDKKVHLAVLKNMVSFVEENGYNVKGITSSPIKGGDGNAEYLIYFDKSEKIVYNIHNAQIFTSINAAVESQFAERENHGKK